MIRIRNMQAVLEKQIWDTLKNMQVIVLFLIYPAVAFVMIQAMGEQTESRYFFLSTFAVMHCVFTPMVSTAAILSEEKEKNTLRVLILSGVKPLEYLCSIGFFVWIATQLTGISFLFMSHCSLSQGAGLLFLFTAGCLPSVLLGMCIGLYAPNMAAANAVAVPVGMVFSFLPMLAFFNQTIEKAARFMYSYQIGEAIRKAGMQDTFSYAKLAIVAVYLIIFSGLFGFLFHKKKWD